MVKINKLIPAVCKYELWKLNKYESCLRKADYEFTNDMEDEKGEYKTITIGYSCKNHVKEINKILKNEVK
tara:strand:- start:1084 stop:1293 length:210 start_codon:yes stop_codon:yes gene_type:complete